jgi:hypothetical protein
MIRIPSLQPSSSKSGDEPPVVERDYIAEIMDSRPVLRLLRSAWQRVRSWEPALRSRILNRLSPRERRRVSRFFRVVDLVDGNNAVDLTNTDQSLTMNFSMLNMWRAIWSNVLDSA